MKLNKIFAVALAVVALTSCDETNVEEYDNFLGSVNTASGVTVGLPQTYTAREDAEAFYVPLEVTGTANGKIQVTVQIKELTTTAAGTEPAKEGEHFNVTSQSVNIPAGDEEVGIEILPIWEQGVVNDDRVFQVEIVSVVGAALGNKTCEVTIANIDDRFTSLLGTWTLNAVNMSTGADVSYQLTFKQVVDDEDPFGRVIYGFGILGDAEYLLPLHSFNFDESTLTGSVEIGYGWMMTDGIAFNYGLEAPAFPVCMYRTSAGLTLSYQAVCTFDDTFQKIEIPAEANICAGLFYTTTMAFSGYVLNPQISNLELVR